MNRYRYLAYETAGRRVVRSVQAGSVEDVKQMAWAEGLHLVEIRRPRISIPSLEEAFPTFIHVRRSEVILFTKQLATFVRVGVPIMDGLTVLREQAGSSQMRKALGEMITDLGTGSSLSDALGRFPNIFSGLYVEMIRSAELSGNLDDVLKQLANYMSRDEGSMRKVRNAMIYPAIVIGLAMVVVSVLIGFVLPAFARLFADFRATMPLPTRILLAVGIFCRDHSALIFITLAVHLDLIVPGEQNASRPAHLRRSHPARPAPRHHRPLLGRRTLPAGRWPRSREPGCPSPRCSTPPTALSETWSTSAAWPPSGHRC